MRSYRIGWTSDGAATKLLEWRQLAFNVGWDSSFASERGGTHRNGLTEKCSSAPNDRPPKYSAFLGHANRNGLMSEGSQARRV